MSMSATGIVATLSDMKLRSFKRCRRRKKIKIIHFWREGFDF